MLGLLSEIIVLVIIVIAVKETVGTVYRRNLYRTNFSTIKSLGGANGVL